MRTATNRICLRIILYYKMNDVIVLKEVTLRRHFEKRYKIVWRACGFNNTQ